MTVQQIPSRQEAPSYHAYDDTIQSQAGEQRRLITAAKATPAFTFTVPFEPIRTQFRMNMEHNYLVVLRPSSQSLDCIWCSSHKLAIASFPTSTVSRDKNSLEASSSLPPLSTSWSLSSFHLLSKHAKSRFMIHTFAFLIFASRTTVEHFGTALWAIAEALRLRNKNILSDNSPCRERMDQTEHSVRRIHGTPSTRPS